MLQVDHTCFKECGLDPVHSCYCLQPLLFRRRHHLVGFSRLTLLVTFVSPLPRSIKCEVSGLLMNAWYLDDGTLCGSPETSAQLWQSRASLCWSLPLVPLSLSDNTLSPDIPTTNEGFELLGSPVGPPLFYISSLLTRVGKKCRSMQAALLRLRLSLPEIAYSLSIHVHQTVFIQLWLPLTTPFGLQAECIL